MQNKFLTQPFFEEGTLDVAQNLLGKFLVRHFRGKKISLMITDVEAYDGSLDKASHASCGKTKRNKVMFGEAGKFYVYFTYGMHWMLNVVTGPVGYPAAVLIRGTDKIEGPARITKYLHVNKKLNGEKAEPQNGLWLEDRGVQVTLKNIEKLPRVGVSYAGKWAKKPYRFRINYIRN